MSCCSVQNEQDSSPGNGQDGSGDIPECSAQELCPRYDGANCSGRIQPNGFRVNRSNKSIIVKPLNISCNASYSGGVVTVCEGAEDVNPLMFEREMISQCNTEVEYNKTQITLSNCSMVVDQARAGIILTNCSNCIQLYILSEFCIAMCLPT